MAIVRFRLDHPDKEKPQKAVSIQNLFYTIEGEELTIKDLTK